MRTENDKKEGSKRTIVNVQQTCLFHLRAWFSSKTETFSIKVKALKVAALKGCLSSKFPIGRSKTNKSQAKLLDHCSSNTHKMPTVSVTQDKPANQRNLSMQGVELLD